LGYGYHQCSSGFGQRSWVRIRNKLCRL